MTTAQSQINGHLLLAPSGKHIVCFTNAGNHQMLMQHYKAIDSGWELYKGGYNWIGNARSYYANLQAKGYRKP
jgi:hypothetical protein